MNEKHKLHLFDLELDAALSQLPHRSVWQERFRLQDYIGTGYEVLGVPSPELKTFSQFAFPLTTLTDEALLSQVDYVWKHSLTHDKMSVCLFAVQRRLKKQNATMYWAVLKHWLDRIDNWAHSDFLSSLYAKMMEYGVAEIYPKSLRWVKSAKAWERRQAVVLMAYASRIQHNRPSYEALMNSPIQCIEDTDYFVQKGVGWAFRDIGKRYPLELQRFLQAYATRLSTIAFATAVEKVEPTFRDELKMMRKKARSKKSIKASI